MNMPSGEKITKTGKPAFRSRCRFSIGVDEGSILGMAGRLRNPELYLIGVRESIIGYLRS